MNPRKASLRNDPNWLTELDLGDELPAEIEIDVSDLEPAGSRPNAAELWATSLPDLAIMARRRELTAEPPWARDVPYTPRYLDAGRHTEHCAERGWVWTLATVLILVALVAACAHVARLGL